MSHRLFVGLAPPPDVLDALADLQDDALAPAARWQSEDQLHLTLRFIGEVDRHAAEDVARALAALRHPPVALRLAPLGLFDRRGRVHTLHAGIEAHDGLLSLARKVARAVESAGLPPEPRAFAPHITLARFGNAGPPREALAPALAQRVPPIEWVAEEMLLYESFLGRGGSHYEIAERYKLA